MAQLTMEDLKEFPSFYDSPRDVGDVLVGEDAARDVIEASSYGNETTLKSLLSQPQWTKIMLDEPHCIFDESRPAEDPNDVREVQARRISNLERALTVATLNGQAAAVSTLLAFAAQQGIDAPEIMSIMRTKISKIIGSGHAAVIKALASADPNFVKLDIGHGMLPLYEAARRRQTDVAAVLLELGADPLHPVQPPRKIYSYNSSLMSLAAMVEGPSMTEMLLERGTPVAHTGALHTAAHRGHLDTMRLLMEHGADVNEVLSNWRNRTPMHFAASQGQVDAMKLLENSGARSDLKDEDGNTPAQLLEGRA